MTTVTNLDSYVNEYKVVDSDSTTVTLENGVTVEKRLCRFISFDQVAGATYYRYDEEA